jgi:hypothetical protein
MYSAPRITNLAIVGKFAAALIAVVVMQGVLSYKFKVFGYFDLPLICSVYYGFTLGNPIASIVIGSFARPHAKTASPGRSLALTE